MKVLHVINSLHFGGAEKLLLDIVPEFINNGIPTDILLLDNTKTPFYKELKQNPIVHIITNTKNYSIYNPMHILGIRSYIKHYDIIHAHLFPSLYWVILASLFLKHKTKFVVTEHSTENRRRNNKFFKYIDRYFYKKFNKIITISKGVKKNLQQHIGAKNTEVVVINNGIKTTTFKNAKPYVRHELNIPENARIVIQVSSFRVQKDHDTLLKAVSLLSENIHVILVGDGILKEEKKQLAASLQIEHRTHFLGQRTDIPRLLKTADIVVLSSHYEGFGLAIVEGMAAGKPCVGSNVSGLSEVIGDAGIVFEPGNHIQLKNILENLLTNEQYYQTIQNQCIHRAQQYDLSLMIDAYENVYKAL